MGIMYKKILDPVSNKFFNINTPMAKNILSGYINNLKGGSSILEQIREKNKKVLAKRKEKRRLKLLEMKKELDDKFNAQKTAVETQEDIDHDSMELNSDKDTKNFISIMNMRNKQSK